MLCKNRLNDAETQLYKSEVNVKNYISIITLMIVAIFVMCSKKVEVEEITIVKCSDCKTIFSAETTTVFGKYDKSKTSLIVGDKIYGKLEPGTNSIIHYKDTLCENCIEQRKIDAKKLYQEGRKAYNKKDYINAKQKFLAAHGKGYKDAYAWLRKTNKKIEAIKKAEEEKAEIIARKAYGKLLREHFLDNGMNIKIRIHGSKNTYATLTYSLIGDVFVHNFKKSTLCNEMHEMGFQRIYLNDGYDYSYYIYWE